MRIISNPNPVPEKIMTCPECDCCFSYNDNDTQGSLGRHDYKEWLYCPNCGRKIIVFDSENINTFNDLKDNWNPNI